MKTDQTLIMKTARFLREAHQKNQRFQSFPDEMLPRSLEEAYRIQEEYVALETEAEESSIAGYKIALTTPVMQKMVGVNHPCSGAILARNVHRSPATLPAGDFIHLGVECEIAFRLAKDIPASQGPYHRDAVADAVGGFMPAFELIEDRNADYGKLHAFPLIADNCWNAGIVLGAETGFPSEWDVGQLNGQFTINNEVKGKGQSADVMGHPLEALAWLANSLTAQGTPLQRGMIVMTGSMIATQFPIPGDVLEYHLGELDVVKFTLI